MSLRYEPRGDEIELTGDRPALFKVFACSTRAVVGFTSIAIFGDECARWESRDSAANPAAEVIGSLMPTLATQPFGFCALPSAPWGGDDFHAELYSHGDTDVQVVSFAPTWLANPTLSEEATHDLEPDERIWSREYAAEPGTTVTAAFDRDDALACFAGTPRGAPGGAIVTTDPSSLRGDAYSYMCGHETSVGEIVITEVDGWGGDELRHVTMADIVAEISARAKKLGTTTVYADQREEAALRSLFAQQGISYTSYAWSETSKDDAVMVLRRLMRERKLFLPEHAQLRREITGLKARLMPSGRVKYESNGLDYVSALITLAHTLVEGSPTFDYARAVETMKQLGII